MKKFIRNFIHTVKVELLGLSVVEYRRLELVMDDYTLVGISKCQYSKESPCFGDSKTLVMYIVSNKTGKIYLHTKDYLEAEKWFNNISQVFDMG